MTAVPSRPRLGFLGLGWIGQHRLRAIIESELAEIAVLADADVQTLEKARELAPQARAVGSFDALLEEPLDGVVIATPSALHARQAVRALERGCAVFCQKPLGRDAGEVAVVLEAARARDRLLGVDFSYRHTEGMRRIASLVRSGELGAIYAANLVFHNAYGPDKPWFYDVRESGGGALMDLGIHLVDLALWVLDFPQLEAASSRLYAQGAVLPHLARSQVEDYVASLLSFASGLTVQLTCSWKLHAGRDCVIEASFYGTRGAASLRNVGGSFYDFEAEVFTGTTRRVLSTGPDAWGGRAAVEWAARLAHSPRYDPECERVGQVARVLDAIYAARVSKESTPCAS
jgi:predicted dehydrogenase